MIPEVLWKHDDQVEAARKLPGWKEFHATCAIAKLFFYHVEKRGGKYVGIALIGSGDARKVAEERGATPVEAITLAYRAAKRPVADAEQWLAMLNNPRSDFDEFEELL